MSLKKKLLLYNLALSTFMVISGVIGYVGSKNTAAKYEHVVQVNMQVNHTLDDLDTAKTLALLNLYRMAHPSFSDDERAKIVELLNTRVKEYKAADESYRAIRGEDSKADEFYKATSDSWKALEADAAKFIELANQKTEDGLKAMQTLMKDNLEKDRITYDESLKKLIAFHNAEADRWVKVAQESSHFANSLGLLALVTALIVFIASGLIIGQAISRQISQLADRLSDSSSGVFQESVRVSTASTELAAAMAEQASAIQETVSAVDEISAMVSKTADNSMRSQSESGRMNEVAMKGKQSLDQVVASISEISDGNGQILTQIEQGNQQLEKIVKLINQIGEKTKVINDIVFQTKLLSFNASVEAARAGEHGKGFAVVAEEVGNLAQMSGNAAKEISEMLTASTTEVNKIVIESKDAVTMLMDRTRGKFEDGKSVARECAQIFDRIIEQMGEVNRNVNDIATASREQTTGIQEINRVMNGLSEATQQNSMTTGQTANSALELKRQAEEVKATVEQLTALVTGENGRSQAASQPRAMRAISPRADKIEKAPIETPISSKRSDRLEKIPENSVEKLTEKLTEKFGHKILKPTVPRAGSEGQKPDVVLLAKTKPIATSALKQAKSPKTNVLPMKDKAKGAAKNAKAEAPTPLTPRPEFKVDNNVTAKAAGSDFDHVPSSDDDRFEKV